jgi:hypothetical protein
MIGVCFSRSLSPAMNATRGLERRRAVELAPIETALLDDRAAGARLSGQFTDDQDSGGHAGWWCGPLSIGRVSRN